MAGRYVGGWAGPEREWAAGGGAEKLCACWGRGQNCPESLGAGPGRWRKSQGAGQKLLPDLEVGPDRWRGSRGRI